MSGSAVELDFFRIEKEAAAAPPPTNRFDRKRSFRDIQSAISKINPELLKTVMAKKTSENQITFPALPVYTPSHSVSVSAGSDQSNNGNAPLTIFYNGTVSVFDVSPHQAENILKLAQGGTSKAVESIDSKLAVPAKRQQQLFEALNQDHPMCRRKSLQRFLEKRKERLTLESPYSCPIDNKLLKD